MSKLNSNLLGLGIATILFSLNGLIPRLTPVPAIGISWARGVFATLTLVLVMLWKDKNLFKVKNPVDAIHLCLLGLVISGTWFFFYVAIIKSTVAVAVISLFTYPFITSLIEPIFFKEKYSIIDLASSLLIILGVFLIVPKFSIDNSIAIGVFWGIMAALFFSLRSVFSRKFVSQYSTLTVLFYQFAVATIVFTPFFFRENITITPKDWIILLILGSIITTFSFIFFTNSLKSISASTASIFVSLQPVCTILLGLIFLNELPSVRTMQGGTVILVTVVVSTLYKLKKKDV